MTADVVSPLLTDPQPESTANPARVVDPDFAATVNARLLETDVDAWAARTWGGDR